MGLLEKFKRKKGWEHPRTSEDGASGEDPIHMFFESAMKYYNAGSIRDAEEKFRNILEINPDNIEAHYYLGLIYKRDKGRRRF